MYSKSDNIEIMMENETDKIIEDLFDSFLQRHNKKITKINGWKEVNLFLIVLIHCNINFIKQVKIEVDHIQIMLND